MNKKYSSDQSLLIPIMRSYTYMFYSFFLLCACGQTLAPQSILSDAPTEASNFVLIPEYANTTAVMLEAGGYFVARDFAPDDNGFNKTLGDEYEALVNSLAGTPSLRPIMYLTNHGLTDIYPSAGNTTEIEHFKSKVMPKLAGGGATIEIRETKIDDDPWTRDFGAFSAKQKDTQSTVLIDYLSQSGNDKRGSKDNQDLAHLLGMPLLNIANQVTGGAVQPVDGGGIMIDSANRCFAAPVTPDASWGCSEVVTFRSLPQDSTGHIDLFAKLLSDKVAVVADFSSDQVLLTKTPEITIDKCDANGCTQEYHAPSFAIFEQNENGGGNRLFSIAEIKNLLASRYSKPLDWMSTISKSPEWQDFHLREFSDETAAKLKEHGYSVSKIRNPPPIAYAWISRKVDTQGKVISESIKLKFAYRSYLNSLIVNKQLLMPSFAKADAATNDDAKNVYSSLGFAVTGIPMDAHAFKDGAVHCMTHEIH